jgi:hypothetical protein
MTAVGVEGEDEFPDSAARFRDDSVGRAKAGACRKKKPADFSTGLLSMKAAAAI